MGKVRIWIRFEAGDWRNVILVWFAFVDAMAEILGEFSGSPRGCRERVFKVLVKTHREPLVVRRPRGPLWDPWTLLISVVEQMIW